MHKKKIQLLMSDAFFGYLLAVGALSLFTTVKRTNVFPIMHVVGIRRELTEQNPWLAVAVLKAFEQSKAAALDKLGDTSATKFILPFIEEQLKVARASMGDDYWSYGVARRCCTDSQTRRMLPSLIQA